MLFRGFLNSFWIKLIMLLLMVLDHIYEFYFAPDSLYWAHALARVVAPVFAYLLAQGMIYTRNRERYILRLYIFAAIMSLGNMIITYFTKVSISNNIFLSLALGASIIYLTDKAKECKDFSLYIALAAGAAVISFYCEGGILVPMSAVIFYYFRANKPLMYAVYMLATGLPYLYTYAMTGNLRTQCLMIFAIIPIMMYNGRRGPDTAFAKYFFYIFYPLHIWAIVLTRLI